MRGQSQSVPVSGMIPQIWRQNCSLARWVIQNKMELSYPLLFVWDTGEEGLGDLKGARGLMKEYDGQIAGVVALDAVYSTMINRAVGSVRYRLPLKRKADTLSEILEVPMRLKEQRL